MSKIIRINEIQKQRLFEAYSEGFSFDKLSELGGNQYSQYGYCVRYLGRYIEKGSSRCVFSLSDNMVLKLACSNNVKMRNAGIEQNRHEYELYMKFDTPLLPKIYQIDDNFTYLVSEAVLPVVEEDFEMFLDLPFNDEYVQNSTEMDGLETNYGNIGYSEYFDDLREPNSKDKNQITVNDLFNYIQTVYSDGKTEYENRRYERVIRNNKWLYEFAIFAKDAKLTDLLQMENYGLVNRDGNPMIVLLDSGFTIDIYKKFY